MSTTTEIVTIESEALTLADQCQAVEIMDQQSYDLAVSLRIAVKEFVDKATAFFEPMRVAAYDAYQQVLNQKKNVIGPAENHLATLNRKLGVWDQEQRRIAEQKRREAEEAARREAEEERLARAVEAEQQGADIESVERIMTESVVVTPVMVEPTYQKSDAITTRDIWSGECTDTWALVRYVAKHRELLHLLQVHQANLNKQAQMQKETMTIPGCRAVRQTVVASSRGKRNG